MLNSETIHPDNMQSQLRAEGDRALGAVNRVEGPNNGVIRLHYGQGTADIAVLGEHIAQITLLAAGESELGIGSGEVTLPPAQTEPDVTKKEQTLAIRAGKLQLQIDLQASSIMFCDENGAAFAQQTELTWGDKWKATAYFAKNAASRFYGLGEKAGFLNKSGERYEMWNTDVYSPHVQDIDALYQSIPFLIHDSGSACYGLFLDNPGRTFFDMRTFEDSYSFGCETGALQYYVIAGRDMKEVIGRYTALTGRMKLPPKWSLGYHQSRYSYMDQEEVLTLARTFREKQIPCDAIYLDIHYMDSYRVFTFDPIRFPDPAGMMAELKELGVRIVPIVDPGVKKTPSDAVYREGLSHDYFCRYIEGELFSGKVWPGESVFPDFSDERTANWWGHLHAFYTEMGIAGIWNDMNEPSVFNDLKTMDPNVMHKNNGAAKMHGEVHNLYGLWMSKATFLGLERLLGDERPFVLTRAGYAGIQKYAAVWTGDNRSYWEHLALSIPMIMNLGMSGVAFTGADVGGFAAHSGGELLARWTQAGALLPYFRNHSELSAIRQEPWVFGPVVEDICRASINLRYRLLPAIYSLFREASETGLPVVRPLVLEYPQDAAVSNLNDQFLLGADILVAPVLHPGVSCRSVYLPEGQWYDFATGEVHNGGQHILADAPLERLPMFVRAGAIVVQAAADAGHAHQHTSELTSGSRAIDIYVPQAGTHARSHYEDDGCTTDYLKGAFDSIDMMLQVEGTGAGEHIVFAASSKQQGFGISQRPVEVTFRGIRSANAAVRAYQADGTPMEAAVSSRLNETAGYHVVTMVCQAWPARIDILSGREAR
ncbi:Alpha-glucosidase [Paenibacillus curdlanolyticus YK9]|uniref:Alpha-glucosidase n=1 Tax=Paenibacillus curdlanolyticus YK9 TaxID=717606 RepID=E0IBH8_9BACL|nr:TIM-barrel domain-containing protein [Paenibacillus curdlanolyticus]EFM10058.1 Alpha-glucosidase [Paenibacillus curdlanolyticus YK9]